MRTYATRSAQPSLLPSSPPPSDVTPPPLKRKRPLTDRHPEDNTPTKKRPRATPDAHGSKLQSTLKSAGKARVGGTKQKSQPKKQPKLTQLHFSLDTSVLRTCPLCDLSFTRGAPDDESLHKTHCARVQRGLEWGKDEEREFAAGKGEELATGVRLKDGRRGRIVCVRPDVGSKIGAKIATLLETISLALSSPPLSPAVVARCKIYLFLLSSATASSSREKIVGCVVAQRISSAMAIAPAPPSAGSPTVPQAASSLTSDAPGVVSTPANRQVVPVDMTTNLYVYPTPLPTPMGIPRLFVSSSHRRFGIASRLLSAAAETFILGCPLDPARGSVAFTQPTGAGKAVLEKWGKGGVRIYEEEQAVI